MTDPTPEQRAAEEERYQRWHAAARDFLSIRRVYPTEAGTKLDADEMAGAFVLVANYEQDIVRDALVAELHRRKTRLEEIEAEPGRSDTVLYDVRGEVRGLQAALGILLGAPAGSGAEDMQRGRDYYEHWMRQQEAAEAYARAVNAPMSAAAAAALRKWLAEGTVPRRRVRRAGPIGEGEA